MIRAGRGRMPIFFQSLRSSSAGNALALWTPTSSILIDCGVRVQRDCRAMLDEHRRRAANLDAVIVSHAHGDHMARGALKVLGRCGVPVLADARVIAQLREFHTPRDWREPPALRAVTGPAFEAGDFRITPVRVPHAPYYPTFGFRIAAHSRGASRTVVVCTDFYDYAGLLSAFAGADFIFLEANHDLALLRQHPNPNSRFHMNNVKTASLLQHVVARDARPPEAVMLGHLSEERNRRALALGEVAAMFERRGTKVSFHLDAAPRYRPSDVVEL
jgi:ribonuclease BN (tRNA processing enzyme)